MSEARIIPIDAKESRQRAARRARARVAEAPVPTVDQTGGGEAADGSGSPSGGGGGVGVAGAPTGAEAGDGNGQAERTGPDPSANGAGRPAARAGHDGNEGDESARRGADGSGSRRRASSAPSASRPRRRTGATGATEATEAEGRSPARARAGEPVAGEPRPAPTDPGTPGPAAAVSAGGVTAGAAGADQPGEAAEPESRRASRTRSTRSTRARPAATGPARATAPGRVRPSKPDGSTPVPTPTRGPGHIGPEAAGPDEAGPEAAGHGAGDEDDDGGHLAQVIDVTAATGSPGFAAGRGGAAGAGTGTATGTGDGEAEHLAAGLLGRVLPRRPSAEAASLEKAIAAFVAFLRRRITGDYEVDEIGFDQDLTENLVVPMIRPIYKNYFRVETRGLENIPDTGGALVVANHSGTLPVDAIMTAIAILDHHPAHRYLRMLAADLVFSVPFLAPLARKTGQTLACQADAERLLTAGEIVGVWPEGFKGIGKPFSERYKLQRFGRGGFVSAALRAGVPIVPCTIIGAEEIYPMLGNAKTLARLLGVPYVPITPTFPWLGLLGLVPLPSKWIISFGEPIETASLGPAAAEDPMVVFELTDRVREIIQHSVYGLLMQRRSVFF